MLKTILRKEHKNKWEKRTCLIASAAADLQNTGYQIDVEKSDIRIIKNEEYENAGCELVDDPDSHQFVLGIKEPPIDSIRYSQVHLAFSHTHKGQAYNMPLLQKFIDEKACLLDYELIKDEEGQRTIAFGRYAGIAGAVDTLSLAGDKLKLNGIKSPLQQVNPSWQYKDVEFLQQQLKQIVLDTEHPIRVLIVGSGKVGKGSAEVCDWLGLEKFPAKDFIAGEEPTGSFYTVLSSRHLYRKKGQTTLYPDDFDYADFLEKGKSTYETIFADLLGRFDIFLHTPYWEEKYPELLPLDILKRHASVLPMLIGDITCDIEGSLACTKKNTDIDSPAITYYPLTDSYVDGLTADGISVMAIDNLPCELSKDASAHFSSILPQYVPKIMEMDLTLSWKQCNLPEILKRAVIVYKGELTPDFEYLNDYLSPG